ncbi:hypothetical protein [uncultured Sphingomonas sp.]|uniref:hypothetical protein n=1 Tax=uncultured Sphingomonas sp. TaxID=158754 RepID=UPI0025CF90BD|nr:hypothetical protein [uncultured Sphingomonas sp.]
MLLDEILETPLPYLADPQAVADATALLEKHGDDACFEAAIRAERYRDQGNAVQFCHWRQIERLIVLLASPDVTGTVH